MGRQLNVGEERSLRQIHGQAGEGRAKRSRSHSRDGSRSSTRSSSPGNQQQQQQQRGFGNICSLGLGPVPEFYRRNPAQLAPGTREAPPLQQQQQPSKVKAGGGAGWHVAAATPRGVQTVQPSAPEGCQHAVKLGDTIVGVTNGGAYTIGPIHSSSNTSSSRSNNNRPQKRRVVLIPLFMLATLAYFLASMYLNNCPSVGRGCTLRFLHRMSFQPLTENPLLGPTSSTLLSVGAVDSLLTPRRKAGWRLLTSLWLPAGLFHLLLLLWGLVSIGIRFEHDFGWLCAGLLYLISGIGGSLVTALTYTEVASAGASSGALLGLLGARLADIASDMKKHKEGRWQQLGWCATTLAACVCVGIMPNVGNLAHLAAFLAGFLLALLFLVRPHLVWRRSRSLAYDPDDCLMSRKRCVWHWALWGLALFLLLAAYAGLAVALLAHALFPRASCSTSLCHHLSCMPTRLWNCSTSIH